VGVIVEEHALYRAILEAPHDDALRLIYADWLDENVSAFPSHLVRSERARAEFIRLQCASAHLFPDGWGRVQRPFAPAHEKRGRRLLFQHGRKWRRAFPAEIASNPFDRGFLRPFRALRPHEFLGRILTPSPLTRSPIPVLPPESPVRRYVPSTESLLLACPLWDVHLFASAWLADPMADRGQYAELLADVASSPLLSRAGWLQVSILRTPVYEFLRTGHFANVETLVLNSGPFPEVLRAVVENESFRSLRYIHFGPDRWAWAPSYAERVRASTLETKLREANIRNLPFGEMRVALRAILRDTPVVPTTPPPAPTPRPVPRPAWASAPDDEPASFLTGCFLLALTVTAMVMMSGLNRNSYQPPPVPRLPGYFPAPQYEPDRSNPKREVLKKVREGKSSNLPESRDSPNLPTAPAPHPGARPEFTDPPGPMQPEERKE
jgi:uncharacterized protein (TIGR02996 family)